MLLAGIKKEEYREIKKYWATRLTGTPFSGGDFPPDFKKFDFVQFTNGYGNKRPQVAFKCEGIGINTGKKEWGAKHKKLYYVIKVGDKHPRVWYK